MERIVKELLFTSLKEQNINSTKQRTELHPGNIDLSLKKEKERFNYMN